MCLHLLVLSIIGTFGYAWQRQSDQLQKKVAKAVARLPEDGVVTDAFLAGLPDLGLTDRKRSPVQIIRRTSKSPIRIVSRAVKERSSQVAIQDSSAR